MAASNFTEDELSGKSEVYARAVSDIESQYGFDFVSLGLTAFVGAPLKWIYSAGATGERYRRIVLAPGHGIGGIVIKAGKPMMFVDIDAQIDPREYTTYPIVFAEDLRSFCALPLKRSGCVVGALLCAFRTTSTTHVETYKRLVAELAGKLCDLEVVSDDFLDFDALATHDDDESLPELQGGIAQQSVVSRVISAQEDERRRISRELHDGLAQEMVALSFLLSRIEPYLSEDEAQSYLAQARANIDRIIDDLHNLSVELRPSALDHLGLVPALRSRAMVIEKTYGVKILFEGDLPQTRFNRTFETQVYRICQEAVINACKYSECDTVSIRFVEAGGWMQISVVDEGCGFNVAQPQVKGSGCGLAGMQERAHLIGATLSVESDEHGTKVVLVAPMGEVKGTDELKTLESPDNQVSSEGKCK